MTTPSGTTTYASDEAERLTSVLSPQPSTLTYTWDNNGELTARGSDSFAWDHENRMTSATGGTTTTFTFHDDGLRDAHTTGGVIKAFQFAGEQDAASTGAEPDDLWGTLGDLVGCIINLRLRRIL